MRSHTKTIERLSITAVAALAMSLPQVASASTIATMPVPPQSYLNHRVDTLQGLITQVSTDPTVRERYASLYHIPQSKVVSYMKANLVESYVPASRTYPVYCVTKSGRAYVIHQHFRAGTRVFALRNGTPVMKWACGNPLTSMLPSPPVPRQNIAKKPSTPFEKVSPAVETVSSDVPVETAISPYITTIPMETAEKLPSVMVAGVTEELITPVAKSASFPILPIIGGGALAATTLIHSTSGGGSGGDTVGGTISGTGGGGTTIVPEPMPLVSLAFGLVPLAGLLIWQRRKRTDNRSV